MKRWLPILLLVWGMANSLAQTNTSPIRLAIVPMDSASATMADLLTVDLSRTPDVILLERATINRVLSEHALSASSSPRDYLKLGQIVSADGLLLLNVEENGSTSLLNVRLVSAKHGVVLLTERYAQTRDMRAWSAAFASRLGKSLAKLASLKKDAIPLSIINLRSATQSAQGRELEKQLKLLTIERLSQEPRVFVLERQQMQTLAEERELAPTDSSFWNGSYLLDCTVDPNGFSVEKVLIDGRLTPPNKEAPRTFQVTGSRTNLAELVNELAVAVAKGLDFRPEAKSWNATDEAAHFLSEANWALQWGLFVEAQNAAESAWALGLQTKDAAALRFRCYLAAAPESSIWSPPRSTFPEPVSSHIKFASQLLDLFVRDTRLIAAEPGSAEQSNIVVSVSSSRDIRQASGRIVSTTITQQFTNRASRAFLSNTNWFNMGLQALNVCGAILQSFNEEAEARSGHEQELAHLRELARETATILEANMPGGQLAGTRGRFSINTLRWEDGGLWFDRPQEALPMYLKMLESGFRTCDIPRPIGDNRADRDVPQLVAWNWEDRQRIPAILSRLSDDLQTSTDLSLQVEGAFYRLVFTPYESAAVLESAQNELYDLIWAHREGLFSGQIGSSVLGRIEATLRDKYGSHFQHVELFHAFRRQLQRDYLERTPMLDRTTFGELFASEFSQSEIAEFRPLVDALKQRLKLSPSDVRWLDREWQMQTDRERVLASHTITNTIAIPRSSASASKAIIAKFSPWKMDKSRIHPNLHPFVESGLVWNRDLWVEVKFWNAVEPRDRMRAIFARVNLETGNSELIEFPPSLGMPSGSFAVTADSLFVVGGGGMQRYGFRTRQWEAISIPMEGGAHITQAKGKLYLSRSDAIIEFDPDTLASQILASSRRRPAANPLDELGGYGTPALGANNTLIVSAQRRLFAYGPEQRAWEEIPIPLATNTLRWSLKLLPSVHETLALETGFACDSQLFAIHSTRPAIALALTHRWSQEGPPRSSIGVKSLVPARWTWPEPFFLPASLVLPDERVLWVLHPNTIMKSNQRYEKLAFDDNRSSTIICFEPDYPNPVCVPVRLEKEGAPFDPLKSGAGWSPSLGEWNADFRPTFGLVAPQGIVVLNSSLEGHYLIPRESLASQLKQLRSAEPAKPGTNSPQNP